MVQGKKVIEEVSGWLTLFDDGSVDRTWTGPPQVKFMFDPVAPHHHFIDGVATADVTAYQDSGLKLRIYLPEKQENDPEKLPIVLHFHGGGFCISEADWFMYYSIYTRLAHESRALVVSVYLHRAPEHRLPAPCDDGFAALLWLQSLAAGQPHAPVVNFGQPHAPVVAAGQPHSSVVNEGQPHAPVVTSGQPHSSVAASGQNPVPLTWLQDHGDFNRVFLIGDSSGGNIVHQVAARAGHVNLSPLRIAGAIPLHPGFCRARRSKSEVEQPETPFLTLSMVDKFLGFALPVGATKDHPITCPMGEAAPPLEEVELPPYLYCVAEQDLLKDTIMEFYEAMKKANKDVELLMSEGVGHSFYLNKIAVDMDPNTALQTQKLFQGIKEFINKH